jgi:hypothetical protein
MRQRMGSTEMKENILFRNNKDVEVGGRSQFDFAPRFEHLLERILNDILACFCVRFQVLTAFSVNINCLVGRHAV